MGAQEFAGFLAAARLSVAELHRLLGFDLWLVTCIDASPRPPDVAALLQAAALLDAAPVIGAVPGQDDGPDDRPDDGPQAQVVLAAAGPMTDVVATGSCFPWSAAFCRRMVEGTGPWLAPDVAAVPAYAEVARDLEARGFGTVRAYLGRPLRRPDGSVVGTVCAYGRDVVATTDGVEHVRLVAELLSGVLGAEERAAARAREAADALELAEHDGLTGLRNRRGWDRALALEQQRVARYGHPASIVTLDLDGLKAANDRRGHAHGDALLRRAAEVIVGTCRPSDVAARLGGDEFGVLAVEADALAARALAARLAHRLRVAGVPAGVGVATRRVGETLTQTTVRADLALGAAKRRRRQGRR